MIIYNVTIKVEHPIAENWLAWLKSEHIPDMINTGCFTHATVLRLIDVDDSEGPTYAVQYHAASDSLYKQYIEKFAEGMRKRGIDKWGDRFVAFRSIMQVVH
ncbi:MAG: DUF4286 family protein [Chitinophagaceae bacterium]